MPDLAGKMAVLDADSRRAVLDIVDTMLAIQDSPEEVKEEIAKRVRGDTIQTDARIAHNEELTKSSKERAVTRKAKPSKMSDEARAAASDRMKAMHARKKEEKRLEALGLTPET